MTTLLVTGGAGFIGSCFVRHELKKHPDYKIINLDALTKIINTNQFIFLLSRREL